MKDSLRDKAMVTVKSSQKIFTDAEIASLTGICVDHIRNFAKSRHLGFIAGCRSGWQAGGPVAVHAIRPNSTDNIVSALHTLGI